MAFFENILNIVELFSETRVDIIDVVELGPKALELLTDPIAISNCEHQRIGDQGRTTDDDTETDETIVLAPVLSRQLRNQSKPGKEITREGGCEGFELEFL